MKKICRLLNLKDLISKKSYFLFGPRQSGKSFLINEQLDNVPVVDLLESETFLRLSQKPSLIRELLPPGTTYAVIDEVQKLPILLDEVHLLIERRGINFLLTGSSARKLKRQGVNMLGGRARSRNLHPLVFAELKEDFELMRALEIGLLPSIFLSDEPEEDLSAYVDDYLRLEIAAEGLTKNLPAFSRFLEVAASTNGQIINYQSISSDAQVANTTVTEYYQVLRDTLIGRDLKCWQATVKRKPVAKSKFYFFDTGVVRRILGLKQLKKRSPDFGDTFEAYIHHELSSYCDYHSGVSLFYWRSQVSKFEVDFILNEKIAIEVKAKDIVSKKDLRGIEAIMQENLLERYFIISLETQLRTLDNGIEIWPWDQFLEKLWNDDFEVL